MDYRTAISYSLKEINRESPYQLVLNEELVDKFGINAAVAWFYYCALFEPLGEDELLIRFESYKDRISFLEYNLRVPLKTVI